VRQGLLTLLNTEGSFDVVGQAENGREAVELAATPTRRDPHGYRNAGAQRPRGHVTDPRGQTHRQGAHSFGTQ